MTKTARGNMTEGVIWKQMLLFTLPLMAGQALQQLYNTVDGIVVGNFINEQALGAVGTCGSLTMLFVILAVGMSNGSSILVSQCFGAGRHEDMRKAVSTSLILMVAIGLVLSIIGIAATRPLMKYVLNVGPGYLDYACTYFRIFAIGLVFQFVYNGCASVLRALGNSSATLYFLIISSVTNIVLDLLFVAVFHWDVAGAAVATVISQALSAVVAVIYMFRKHEVLKYQKGEFKVYGDTAKICVRLALPTTLQQCVVGFGNLAVQRLINTFDVTYVGLMAGNTAGVRLQNYIGIPVYSFNTTVATFTGQNVGAGKFDRVVKGRRAAMLMGLGICAVIAGLAVIFRYPLVGLFGVEGDALKYGVECLTIIGPCLLMHCMYMTTMGVMTGAGDVTYNMFVSMTSLTLRCLLAYLLAYFTPMGYLAIWWSLPMSWVYNVVMSWSRFYSGAWKKKALLKRAAAQKK